MPCPSMWRIISYTARLSWDQLGIAWQFPLQLNGLCLSVQTMHRSTGAGHVLRAWRGGSPPLWEYAPGLTTAQLSSS